MNPIDLITHAISASAFLTEHRIEMLSFRASPRIEDPASMHIRESDFRRIFAGRNAGRSPCASATKLTVRVDGIDVFTVYEEARVALDTVVMEVIS